MSDVYIFILCFTRMISFSSVLNFFLNFAPALILLTPLMSVSNSTSQDTVASTSAFKRLDSKLAPLVGIAPSATKSVHVFYLETPEERQQLIQSCMDSATPTYFPPSTGDGLGDLGNLLLFAPLNSV